MKKQAKLLTVCGITMMVTVGYSQNYLAESNAAIDMSNTMNSQPGGQNFGPGVPGGPAPLPGAIPGVAAPAGGFSPAGPGGNTVPGGGPPYAVGGYTDPMMGGMEGNPGGANTAAYAAVPTPIPSEKVLTGRRVYDAVSGGLLEDAIEISVRQSDAEVFPDDGVNDNGIAGDGVRGNVRTSKQEFIGPFSNIMKNYLVHAVENAEEIDPMIYYGYHVATIAPTQTEGLKRYGLPLNEEKPIIEVPDIHPEFASVINLERDRDEILRQWNFKFLADYRVNRSDPQSEYYPVFVPSPPLTPVNYPVPNGYVAPQAAAQAANTQLDAEQQNAAAQAASSASSNRGSGGQGGMR